MIGQNLIAQNNGSSTTGAPAQDPVIVKNYMPQPKVVVTNPDVRVPVNIYMEYPPAPQAPAKDYDYISPYMIFIVIIIAIMMLLCGLFWGVLIRGRNNNNVPAVIHVYGGAGGSGGDALAEMHSSTTITGPTK